MLINWVINYEISFWQRKIVKSRENEKGNRGQEMKSDKRAPIQPLAYECEFDLFSLVLIFSIFFLNFQKMYSKLPPGYITKSSIICIGGGLVAYTGIEYFSGSETFYRKGVINFQIIPMRYSITRINSVHARCTPIRRAGTIAQNRRQNGQVGSDAEIRVQSQGISRTENGGETGLLSKI